MLSKFEELLGNVKLFIGDSYQFSISRLKSLGSSALKLTYC